MNEKATFEYEVIEVLTKIQKDISLIKVFVIIWGILTVLGICAFLFNLMNLGVLF